MGSCFPSNRQKNIIEIKYKEISSLKDNKSIDTINENNTNNNEKNDILKIKDNKSKKINEIYKNNPFIKLVLDKHNNLRNKHNSPPLEFNIDLYQMAQNYAKQILYPEEKNNFSNIYKEDIIGENIFILNGEKSFEEICDEWYKENINYNYDLGKFQKDTGHFTQLVWKKTTQVGFGFISDNKKSCGVALYYPAGNCIGEFADNVLKEKN